MDKTFIRFLSRFNLREYFLQKVPNNGQDIINLKRYFDLIYLKNDVNFKGVFLIKNSYKNLLTNSLFKNSFILTNLVNSTYFHNNFN